MKLTRTTSGETSSTGGCRAEARGANSKNRVFKRPRARSGVLDRTRPRRAEPDSTSGGQLTSHRFSLEFGTSQSVAYGCSASMKIAASHRHVPTRTLRQLLAPSGLRVHIIDPTVVVEGCRSTAACQGTAHRVRPRRSVLSDYLVRRDLSIGESVPTGPQDRQSTASAQQSRAGLLQGPILAPENTTYLHVGARILHPSRATRSTRPRCACGHLGRRLHRSR